MRQMKTIAMYLPQFHEVPENSEWWGEGFTEWVAVKGAEKLFEGHDQPREPLNDNYYDLLDKTTMEHQAQMAHEYGLDGFCFYHYYFKEGRKILEKPAENLLQWTDIDMPFCFCWANESWGRTWSKMNHQAVYVNSWAEKLENQIETEKKDGLLLEQKYGREEAWEEHFKYLLPFFLDRRYIKKDGNPILLIYKPADIFCFAEMILYWRKKIRENGFNDIYVIGLNTIEKLEGLDAVLINGPAMYFKQNIRGGNILSIKRQDVNGYRYEEVWENAIASEPVEKCQTYFGGFTDFDDTPRRGKNGWFLEGASPELFEKYIYLLMRKNKAAGNEFTFINAFNEWGEGMYLEPDKKNGYAYLEILHRVKAQINGIEPEEPQNLSVPILCEANVKFSDLGLQRRVDKLKLYVNIMDSWLSHLEQKQPVADFLRQYNYNKVAVYGLGILGRHLIFELLQNDIEIVYTIDRNEQISYSGIPHYSLRADLPMVDAIVVTTVYEFNDIWKTIRNCGMECSIVSLAEIFL